MGDQAVFLRLLNSLISSPDLKLNGITYTLLQRNTWSRWILECKEEAQ